MKKSNARARCISKRSRRYVEGYKRFPESRAEVRAAAVAAKRLAEEPWE